MRCPHSPEQTTTLHRTGGFTRPSPGYRPGTMSEVAFHLAQANMSRLRFPPGAPRGAEIMAATDRINRLAAQAPGFVWRLRAHFGRDERSILNVSVWTSFSALYDFTYRTAHNHYIRRQRHWFEPVERPSTVLWWIPAGTLPTLDDAHSRLRHLRAYGPGPKAFSLRVRYDPAGNRERTTRHEQVSRGRLPAG